MAIVIKALGFGTLITSGTADLYTVPSAKSAIVNNIRLVNGNTSTTQAMNLYVRPSGTSSDWRIHKKDFTMAANASLVLGDVVTLGQGDKVRLSIGSSQNVAYMLNGVERDN